MVEWEGCRNRVYWPEIFFTLEYSIRIPFDVMHRRYPDRQDLLTLDTLVRYPPTCMAAKVYYHTSTYPCSTLRVSDLKATVAKVKQI